MLGNEIKHHRQRMGLSTKELARLVGVAPVTVDGWESGELKVPRAPCGCGSPWSAWK